MEHDEKWLDQQTYDTDYDLVVRNGHIAHSVVMEFTATVAMDYAEHMCGPLLARIKELEVALQRAHLSLYENELEAAEAYRIDRPIFRHHPLLIKE